MLAHEHVHQTHLVEGQRAAGKTTQRGLPRDVVLGHLRAQPGDALQDVVRPVGLCRLSSVHDVSWMGTACKRI